MAILGEGEFPRDTVTQRFRIAQDGPADPGQLAFQADIRDIYRGLADSINNTVTDSREKSLALTALEESLMWLGKAIFKARD